MKRYDKNKLLLFFSVFSFFLFFLFFACLFRIKVWSFQEFQMIKINSRQYSVFAKEKELELFFHRQYFYASGKKVSYKIVDYQTWDDLCELKIEVKQEWKEDVVVIEVKKKRKSIFQLILESWRKV